ncbi:succinate dehydrogenase, partial [Barnesiella sp. GGCC_0306]|nr:succinate dehydrogenase [Barnesiella sp. GGCC_0306]
MAITGTIFALFVFVHMVGNLKAFMGPGDYNAYAEFLRTVLYPLFPVGGVLW